MEEKFCIAMTSDFFYPNTGGVEGHIYSLSQCLLARGHKVIVITHAYGKNNTRIGVRWLTPGLKVYYLPFRDFYNKCTFPTVFGFFPLIREVLVREAVEIVHAHSAFSNIGSECIMHAKSLDIKAVFTDHSLFGFADISSILTNKLLQFSLSEADHAICVSHTSRENTVLRSFVEPLHVSVIPNAIDSVMFTPDKDKKLPEFVTVVVVSRLVYRKGADLLAGIIPLLCLKYENLRFLIGGDGDRRLVLEELREQHNLQDRVILLGSIPHHEVRSLLVQGDIFLNTSLTEAFCIAIVEAISCGLSVVSTNVGGIPEVVPSSAIRLVEPSVRAIGGAVEQAVQDCIFKQKNPELRSDPWDLHKLVKHCYTWPDVAERTEIVYEMAKKQPKKSKLKRLRAAYSIGPVAGKVFFLWVLIDLTILAVLEFLKPARKIELAENFTQTKRSCKQT